VLCGGAGQIFFMKKRAQHLNRKFRAKTSNEYTGVWCVKAMDRQAEQIKAKYPSLDISTLLANPQAHLENKRFIDTDLNREFTETKLLDDEGMPKTIESLRAKELNELLGKSPDGTFGTDLIVDLHSTTSNMGITVIIPEGDAIMGQAAAYVMQKCNAKILMHSIPSRKARPNLSSAAKHGFTIEVGPVPQGVLRHDIVEKTEEAIEALLDFMEKRNAGQDVVEQLQKSYPTVPCFRSAPSKQEGQLCGKIQWPTDPENPNFPLYLIHKSLQDRDFHVLRKGDPLFVTLDDEVIPYDGSHGDEVYLIFVNEGGYYYQSSGTGIGVCVEAKYDIDSGMLVQDECEDS
jgi:aspartoacylase